MLIFANGVGRLTVIPSQLNQNSNRANTIYLTGAFPSAAVVTLAFTLPDGTHTEPQLMSGDKTIDYNGEKFIVREYTIPKNITQVKGRATVQFYITSNNGEETLATEATDITIATGVPALTPAAPTENVYNQILAALSSIQTEFTNKLDKVTGPSTHTLLYSKDKAGGQMTEFVDEAASGRSIPRRLDDGTINVATAKTDDNAVNLKQMIDKIAEAIATRLSIDGGVISGDLDVDGNFVVKGDFTAQGKTFIEDATTLAVKNAIIETNVGKIDLQTLLSGLVINKSPDEAYGLVYDPTDDTVKFGKGKVDETGKFTFDSGEGSPITTRADSKDLIDKNLVIWDSAKKRLVDAGSRAIVPVRADLNQVVESLTYDTNNGLRYEATGELVSIDDSLYNMRFRHEIPIFPGTGIIIDQLENEYKVVIKVDETVARTNQENTFTKPIKFGDDRERLQVSKSSVWVADDVGQQATMSTRGFVYTNFKNLFGWGVDFYGTMYYEEFDVSGQPLAIHSYNFPKKSGTFALTSDIPSTADFIKQPDRNHMWAVLATDPDNNNLYYPMFSEVVHSSIPYRERETKNFKVGDLTESMDGGYVVNKKYVDENFAKLDVINTFASTVISKDAFEGEALRSQWKNADNTIRNRIQIAAKNDDRNRPSSQITIEEIDKTAGSKFVTVYQRDSIKELEFDGVTSFIDGNLKTSFEWAFPKKSGTLALLSDITKDPFINGQYKAGINEAISTIGVKNKIYFVQCYDSTSNLQEFTVNGVSKSVKGKFAMVIIGKDYINSLAIVQTGSALISELAKTTSKVTGFTPSSGNFLAWYEIDGTLEAFIGGGATAVIIDSPASAVNGTLTADQLSTLQANDSNYIIFNNELYRLADKQHTTGILSYVHTGWDGTAIMDKSINVTISTRAWTLVVGTASGKLYLHDIDMQFTTSEGEEARINFSVRDPGMTVANTIDKLIVLLSRIDSSLAWTYTPTCLVTAKTGEAMGVGKFQLYYGLQTDTPAYFIGFLKNWTPINGTAFNYVLINDTVTEL